MNDLELIRSFRSDVQAPDDERVGAARAVLLAECASAPAGPRRRLVTSPRLTALISVPALGGVVAAVLIATLGGGGTDTAGAAIVRHAQAAMSPPPNKILHTEVAGAHGFGSYTYELTSAPYSFLAAKGQLGVPASEEADNGTTASYYDPTTNTIHEMPRTAGVTFGDPLAEVRQALGDGRARWVGTAELNGTATYKIQFAGKDGFKSQSLVVYVDEHTYRPIALDDPQRTGAVVRLRVVSFEYLPATAANLQLLSLRARHPSARVVADRGSAKDAPSAGK